MKKLFVKLAVVQTAALLAIGSAHAALPASVSTAVTEYQTDATTAIGMVMAAGVVIWGLNKLAVKLGWK